MQLYLKLSDKGYDWVDLEIRLQWVQLSMLISCDYCHCISSEHWAPLTTLFYLLTWNINNVFYIQDKWDKMYFIVPKMEIKMYFWTNSLWVIMVCCVMGRLSRHRYSNTSSWQSPAALCNITFICRLPLQIIMTITLHARTYAHKIDFLFCIHYFIRWCFTSGCEMWFVMNNLPERVLR